MSINNFKELEKEQIRSARKPLKRIKNSVTSSLGIFQFIGEVVELYMPRVIAVFLSMGGAEEKKTPRNKQDRYPNRRN